MVETKNKCERLIALGSVIILAKVACNMTGEEKEKPSTHLGAVEDVELVVCTVWDCL